MNVAETCPVCFVAPGLQPEEALRLIYTCPVCRQDFQELLDGTPAVAVCEDLSRRFPEYEIEIAHFAALWYVETRHSAELHDTWCETAEALHETISDLRVEVARLEPYERVFEHAIGRAAGGVGWAIASLPWAIALIIFLM